MRVGAAQISALLFLFVVVGLRKGWYYLLDLWMTMAQFIFDFRLKIIIHFFRNGVAHGLSGRVSIVCNNNVFVVMWVCV